MTGQILLALLLCGVTGYLLGSINWGIILTRLFRREDIRSFGSGNAGMTNVLRSVGKLPALLIRLLGPRDAVFFPELVKYAQLVAGTACVLGHNFPVFYGFRGGKGIVCSAAMMSVFDWRVFLIILLTFGIVFLCRFIISLASVVCAILYPVYTFLLCYFLD